MFEHTHKINVSFLKKPFYSINKITISHYIFNVIQIVYQGSKMCKDSKGNLNSIVLLTVLFYVSNDS